MDNQNKYPHLTQRGGAWAKQFLDSWIAVKNRLVPMRISPQELDKKIAIKFRYEYDSFRDLPDACIEMQPSISMRSPYSNTQAIYTIHGARAILCLWFDFSYHNWLKFSKGGSLGKMCDAGVCINPRHYEFGGRKSRLNRLTLDLPQELERVIPPDDSAWIDLEDTISNLVSESIAIGDPSDKIISAVTAIATGQWGTDRPLPRMAGWSSIRECVEFKVKPTGELPSNKLAPVITSEEVADIIRRKE